MEWYLPSFSHSRPPLSLFLSLLNSYFLPRHPLPPPRGRQCGLMVNCALSPVDTKAEETCKRDDVLLNWVMEDDGEYQVHYGVKPLSHSQVGLPKVSTTASLDAVGTLLGNPALNPGGAMTTGRVNNSFGLCLPEDSCPPLDPKGKPLDVPGLLVRVKDGSAEGCILHTPLSTFDSGQVQGRRSLRGTIGMPLASIEGYVGS